MASSTDLQSAGNPERIGAGNPDRPAVGRTEIGIAAGAYLVLAVLLAFAVAAGTSGDTPSVLAVSVAAASALGAALIALSVRVRSLAAVGLRRVSGKWILIGLGAGLAVWVVNRIIIVSYVVISGDKSNPQSGLTEDIGTPLSLIGILAIGAVLVPIGEELLFRGILFAGLHRYGMVVATIISACLFGLAHGVNIVLPAAIVLGVVNAVLYEKSRSIWPAVAAHAINNALVFSLAAVVAS